MLSCAAFNVGLAAANFSRTSVHVRARCACKSEAATPPHRNRNRRTWKLSLHPTPSRGLDRPALSAKSWTLIMKIRLRKAGRRRAQGGARPTRVPVGRADVCALYRQDDQEKTQNQNQNKGDHRAECARFLQAETPAESWGCPPVRAESRELDPGSMLLQRGACIVVRNRDAGEQDQPRHEDRGQAQNSHTTASRVRALPLAPPVASQCADAQERPREV